MAPRGRARPVVLLLLVLASQALVTPTARAARIYTYHSGAPPMRNARAGHATAAARPAATSRRTSPQAPSAPPLVAGTGTTQGLASGGALGEGESAGGDASSSAPASGGDPLVENGLGSPLCGAGANELSAASQRNCATSGFEAAGAPTGDYGLDVHIDTGALGFTAATLEQDYLIGPVWMGLVWTVHTLVVALEWCFTLDLLSGATMLDVERALQGAQTAFTGPWLVLALALASIATAYNGLIRRRVAETLGQAALMLAMMAAGLWVIADPAGTVGALGRWVDAASVGTLGAAVEGSPAHAPRTLADSMGGLFAGVVGAPWCYLEFGNVRWCTEPALLDPRLRAAGLRIAAAAAAAGAGGCAGSTPEAVCQTLEGEQSRARIQSAALLRAARSNGELFLALPADQAARNSINDHASLLSVLCGGRSDATDCRGPTAPQAEFRTQGGTAARLGGLLLIALGALGMLLLLGYIALHLLGSEILGLVYLLLAPAAVIAPALGDGGRAAFRSWAARLLGAVASKLLFSFLLGVVLMLTHSLMELSALGWWTRWLLVSALWWGAYLQRRSVLGFIEGARSPIARRGSHAQHEGSTGRAGHAHAARPHSIAHRVQRQLESPLAAARAARWVRGKLAKPAPEVESRQPALRDGAQRKPIATSAQAARMLEHERAQARADLADAPRARAEIGAKQTQLSRIRHAQAAAEGAGERRRAAALQHRARRVEGEIARAQQRLNAARETTSAGERARRATGRPHTRAELAERGRFLDAQAALPGGGRSPASGFTHDSARHGARRDYAALASLVGYRREQYARLDPRHRREARLQIDRELAQRPESTLAARDPAAGARERTSHTSAGDGALRDTAMRSGGSGESGGRGGRGESPTPTPMPPRPPRPADTRTRAERHRAPAGGHESSVMRDAHAVAQRRKRQLGYDR